MTGHPIFISHASADDTFVAELRQRLEAHHLPVWVDSRNLRGGDKLAAELTQAIKLARQFIVVLSPQTVNSPLVRREIDQALKVERLRHADGYRVIPLLLSGITPQALGNWFKKEPVAVPIQLGIGGLAGAWPAILSALGERLPTDLQPAEQLDAKPLEELLLTLTDPKVEFQEGSRSITATATLVYKPANISARRVESRRFTLTVPLGPIEADDLRWYLERYHLWPVGVFKDRADGIERKLPLWGQSIFKAALGSDVTREALAAWQHASEGAERRFSVQVDKDLPDGASAEAQSAAGEAAAQWLALPWELLHDGRGWLFQGRYPVRVRRRLPNRREQPVRSTTLPIRILLVSPRPDQDEKGHPLGYIDHRISARPLIEAVETLGELVCLTLLAPPTYSALSRTLQEAADRGEPFDAVHFDGHGAYSRGLGMGGLCFEDPNDADKLIKRTMEFIDAHKLAGLFRQHRVPLVFLEACQSAQAEADPAASVAASLLEEGVTSVVAMTHSVMVETSRRFVQAFYSALVRGARVGGAMLAGQRALFDDSQRGKVMGAGDLSLQDWFVPVIYQEEQDLRLINRIPAKELQQLEERKRRLSLGALPDEPTHKFQGRSRELLELERLLLGPYGHPWAVVRGAGGVGKTALAVELARWLTRTGRFERAAFVSLERHSEARAVLDTLGHQLLPQGDKYSVAQFRDLDQARQPVERALRDHATIVVVDNCESVLSALLVSAPVPAETLVAILALFNHLIAADPRTRLIFTTREPLPIPFDHPGRVRELGALNRLDAIELVSGVLKQHGWTPPLDDASGTPQEIANLVDAVHCHARALVLLAPEVARQGISATIAEVGAVIAELELKNPGDREKSLHASVALSLRRLPPASRVRIQALAVCQGGAHLVILAALTGLGDDAAQRLAQELIDVGLGEDMGYGHLRLDPGLPLYLLSELTMEKVEKLRSRWAEAMAQLTEFLSRQRCQNVHLAAQLTLLELPNLMGMLDWTKDRWPPERMVELAEGVERLVTHLGRPQALARSTRIREQAVQKLGGWSHARFVAESASIDRLIERGELPAAQAAAQKVLASCLAGGDSAYPGALYDTAQAHFRTGRVFHRSGNADNGLVSHKEAQRRFQQLASAGDASAARMAAVVLNEMGDCFQALGRLDEATAAYEECIKSAEQLNDRRSVAVAKGQFASVRRLQRRHADALALYVEAQHIFTALGEPLSVAIILHHIGVVHEEAGQLEAAEQSYRQSLVITVRENNDAGQANTLNQLGNLYDTMGRPEDSVAFYRQSAEVHTRLQDFAREGSVRHNLADTLMKLRRYDEARQQLERALECGMPFGHTASPWKTWANLEKLERATGHAEAAMAARSKAIQYYLAYRRTGGYNQSNRAQFFAIVIQAVQQNKTSEASQYLDALVARPDASKILLTLISKLQSILTGDRSLNLTVDVDLHCMDAAELQLLIASLLGQS